MILYKTLICIDHKISLVTHYSKVQYIELLLYSRVMLFALNFILSNITRHINLSVTNKQIKNIMTYNSITDDLNLINSTTWNNR